jgi:hypothetical protein
VDSGDIVLQDHQESENGSDDVVGGGSVPQYNVCIDVDAAWIPKYTLVQADTFDDSHKKSAVWDLCGHL